METEKLDKYIDPKKVWDIKELRDKYYPIKISAEGKTRARSDVSHKSAQQTLSAEG